MAISNARPTSHLYDCPVAYFDHAATTAVRESALAELVRCTQILGNPSSVHAAGQAARAILESARDRVAAALNCNRSEVIFTSGGTESNNQAIKGLYWKRQADDPKQDLIISAATEHHALIDPIEWLEQQQGARVHWLSVDSSGHFDLAELQAVLKHEAGRVALVSLMWANNETGALNDIPEVCRMAAEFGVPVHSDAVATLGHHPVDFAASGLTAMSISGHKVGAPIGIGALLVSRTAKPVSLLHGGGQERGLRSGTMNYPLASAFAVAVEEAVAELPTRTERLRQLRDSFEQHVLNLIPDARITVGTGDRLPDNAHLMFPGLLGDTLLYTLDAAGAQVSTGSACQAGVVGPSHVLIGMGYSEQQAKSCIRVTFGHTTTPEDLEFLKSVFLDAYQRAKRASNVGV